MSRLLRRRCMTLVEILVAMAILVVIMYIVARMFHSTQLLWRRANSLTETYEQGRLVLDIVTRDLQGIATSGDPGAEITFTNKVTVLPDSTTWRIAFVTTSGLGTTAADDDETLMEVGYALEGTHLVRYMTRQHEGTDWDFLGASATTWAGNLTSWSTDTAVLADNVSAFTIETFMPGVAIPLALGAEDDTSARPSHFRITLELDPLGDASQVRAYTKTVALPALD